MKDWVLEYKYYILAAIGLSGLLFFYQQENKIAPVQHPLENEFERLEQKENTKEEVPVSIVVDVKGEVKKPGVYHVADDKRVIDIIEQAGGLTENANKTQVNFAQRLVDEMVIYIPAIGEEGDTGGSGTFISGTSGETQNVKININRADATELQQIPGIGPSKAAAIIDYREKNGLFKEPEDLKNISGIGEKTFAKLADFIIVR